MNSIPFGRIFNTEGPWCQNTPVPLTGTLVLAELARIPLPGGYMGPGGQLDLDFIFTSTAVAAQTLAVQLNGTEIFTVTVAAAGHTREVLTFTNRNDPAVQILNSTEAPDFVITDFDTEADMVLTVTGILADITDTLTLEKITSSFTYRT
jgi:hypothetical protein